MVSEGDGIEIEQQSSEENEGSDQDYQDMLDPNALDDEGDPQVEVSEKVGEKRANEECLESENLKRQRI